jgi:nucleoside-diphosphate-sugar epimerase
MKRVLVTGARGFLGGAAARLLKARGWDVVGVSSSEAGGYLQADLLDETVVRAMIHDVKPSYLLHAAWLPIHGDVMRSPKNLMWLKASVALVHAFHEEGGRRAAVVGTSAEYDWSNGMCRNNITPMRPASVYGACKHALHIALEAYARVAELGFVWPRVFDVYGPREHDTRLVASVMRSLMNGQFAECTHGMQLRDYLYVDDVARGLVAALESEYNGAVDLAGGSGVRVRDVVLQIARELGREDLVRFGVRPPPVHDVPVVIGDGTEAAALLGWKPTYSLEAGIAATIASTRAMETRAE